MKKSGSSLKVGPIFLCGAVFLHFCHESAKLTVKRAKMTYEIPQSTDKCGICPLYAEFVHRIRQFYSCYSEFYSYLCTLKYYYIKL